MITQRIEINPRVCGGTPVIRGTRIPVAVILEQIAAGQRWEDILDGYPELLRDDLKAAVLFAKSCVEHTEMVVKR